MYLKRRKSLLFLFYNFKNSIELKNEFIISKDKKDKIKKNDKILYIKIKILEEKNDKKKIYIEKLKF